MKNLSDRHNKRIAIAASAAVAIIVLVMLILGFYAFINTAVKEISVSVDGEPCEGLDVDGLALNAGEDREYEIGLKTVFSGSYIVRLGYSDVTGGEQATECVSVEISADGQTVYGGTLRELSDGRTLTFGMKLNPDSFNYVYITYTLTGDAFESAESPVGFRMKISLQKN